MREKIALAQRRDPDPRPKGREPGEIRRPRRCADARRGRQPGHAGTMLASGTRTTSRSSPRSAARFRYEHIVEGDDADRSTSATLAGRSWSTRGPAPAIRSRTPRGTSSPTTTSLRGRHRECRRGADHRRHPAGQDPARSAAHPGHHRRPPRVTELSRGPRSEGAAVIAEIDGRVELL